MPAPFPYPDNGMNGTVGLLGYADSLTEGFLGIGILIVLGVISFIATKVFSSEKAAGFSAFLLFIAALFLRYMNLISDGVLYVVILIFIAVFVWMWYSRESETV